MTRSQFSSICGAACMALSLAALAPAFAQDLAPAGGTTLQEGVDTQPTRCPDGSLPASDAAKAPTDTTVPPTEVPAGSAADAPNPMDVCQDTTATTGNTGNADETPSGTVAPAMK